MRKMEQASSRKKWRTGSLQRPGRIRQTTGWWHDRIAYRAKENAVWKDGSRLRDTLAIFTAAHAGRACTEGNKERFDADSGYRIRRCSAAGEWQRRRPDGGQWDESVRRGMVRTTGRADVAKDKRADPADFADAGPRRSLPAESSSTPSFLPSLRRAGAGSLDP